MVFVFPKLNSIKYPGCIDYGKYHLPLHIEAEFYYTIYWYFCEIFTANTDYFPK
jgi:hypothetical protein